MPLVYRIARAPYSDLSGDGARLYGGRWNPVGAPAVYTCENRALAVLELLVHVRAQRVPGDLVLLTISIPDSLPTTRWGEERLPVGWREPGADSARELGSEWLALKEAAALAVPSAVLPAEHNVIINPLHADHPSVRIVAMEPFRLDARLLAS